MQSTKIVFKILALIFAVCSQNGCANLASNPNACREAPPLLPLPHVFAGNVFQVSPCTSIEPLRIETGGELDFIRSGVTRALDSNQMNEYVDKFADRMGCEYSSHSEFFNELIKNRDDIFGNEIILTNRQAVIKVRKITKTNPILKEACWKR